MTDVIVKCKDADCKICADTAKSIPSPQAPLATMLETPSPKGILKLEEPTSIEGILQERGSRYGEFAEGARITDDLLDIMKNTPNWEILFPAQRYSLIMIAAKISRVLNGDCQYLDNWTDISGYSNLVIEILKKGTPK